MALYCAERGTEEVINQANDPLWIDMLPDDIAGTITGTLQALANALRDNIDPHSLDAVARELQSLRASPHPQDTKRVWIPPISCGSPTTCTADSLSSPYFSAVTRARDPPCPSTYPPSSLRAADSAQRGPIPPPPSGRPPPPISMPQSGSITMSGS